MTPFKLKITQCNVGKYYLNSSEEKLSFYLGIYTEDNKVYEENGIKAILHYSGDPNDLYIFEDALNNLGEVFQKCFEYSNKVWSSVDYKTQCLLFAKIYYENFDILETNMKQQRDKDILEKIERFRKQLSCGMLNDISYEVEESINKQIKENQKMIDYYLQKNSELKEGTETYNQNSKYIDIYEKSNEKLKESLLYTSEKD